MSMCTGFATAGSSRSATTGTPWPSPPATRPPGAARAPGISAAQVLDELAILPLDGVLEGMGQPPAGGDAGNLSDTAAGPTETMNPLSWNQSASSGLPSSSASRSRRRSRQPLDRWLAARRQGPGAPGRVAPAALAVPSQGHHQRGTP